MQEKNKASERTKRRLRTAFCQLLNENNYRHISVKDLTDAADMSRAAFYLHFSSMAEFMLYCKNHIIDEFCKQLIFFIEHKDNLDEVCRKSNLIISGTDRQLFLQYRKQEIYFQEAPDYNAVKPHFVSFFDDRFSEGFSEKNSLKFDFFVRAYTITFMGIFDEYSREKSVKELGYTFFVWDKLFPDYKL